MAKRKRSQPTVYYVIITLTAALMGIGIVMVAAASSVNAYTDHQDSFFYLWRQAGYAAIGLAAMIVAAKMPRTWLKGLSPWSLGLAILLLVAVVFVGKEAGGAKRWLVVGSFQFQPSEFVKLAVVLFTADLLSRKRKQAERLAGVIKPLGWPIVFIAALMMAQPDLGTTVIVLAAVFIMLYLADIRLRELLALALAGMAAAIGLVLSDKERLSRVTVFLDSSVDPGGDGYQLVQSLLALGSGGWTGVGIGMSRQKYYLPAPYTDFIFAVIGEELGLLGTLFVVLLYIFLALAIMGVVRRCRDLHGKLLAGGLGAMVIGQAFINIGGVTNMMPMTGVPLPLISAGGTSLIFTMTSIGIILNLAKQQPKGRKGADREGADMRGRNSRPRLPRPSAGRSS